MVYWGILDNICCYIPCEYLVSLSRYAFIVSSICSVSCNSSLPQPTVVSCHIVPRKCCTMFSPFQVHAESVDVPSRCQRLAEGPRQHEQ